MADKKDSAKKAEVKDETGQPAEVQPEQDAGEGDVQAKMDEINEKGFLDLGGHESAGDALSQPNILPDSDDKE